MKLNKKQLLVFKIVLPLFLLFGAAFWAGWIAKAATNIDPTYSWAWNDTVGWFDFYSTNSVQVKGEQLTGYASSSVGILSLDCATTPGGNICGVSQYQICNGATVGTACVPAADGNLSGYAWDDTIGWVSFSCADLGVCASSDYQVTIDSSGDFNGYAWNDTVGWISFNCAGPSLCGVSDYKVKTSWRTGRIEGQVESISFDMEKQGALNNIIWQGAQPAGTCVKFQIAVSDDPTGPFIYGGAGQSDTTYFGNTCPGPNSVIKIGGTDRGWVNNHRYLRYKAFLESNTLQDQTPTVDSVILNWSP